MPNTPHDAVTLKQALQAFQAKRLRDTYADLAERPRYRKILDFFFDNLYAPKDFSFRNTSAKKLHKALKGKIPKTYLAAAAGVIELQELTDRMDDMMVAQMMAMEIGPYLNMARYKQVFRSLDNYDQRLLQIQMAASLTRTFHRLSHKWLVGMSLSAGKAAAHLLGMGEVMDLVHEGYEGFRDIKHIDELADTMEARELAWLDEIWFETL